MKIAIVSDWFAPRRGGIEGQLWQLAQRLGAAGHEIEVITPMPSASNGTGFRVRPLDVLTLPRIQLAVSPTLPRALHRELRRGYDVVHAHVSVVSPAGYVGAMVARSIGLPTVVTFHSVLRQKRHLLRAANVIAGIGGSAVVWSAVSELVAGQVRDALDGPTVRVLPNGIDLSFWTDRATERSRSADGITLVSTMRLHRKKRPLELVRAFAQATSRVNVGARLLIVGDGPQRAAVEREIRDLGLGGGRATVEVLGWRDHHELRALYRDADGFVLPSTREAFGIAALEARAAGVPVIAMQASGSSEFLNDGVNALVCGDDEQLMQSLARFLDDAALRDRLAKARSPLGRYDWAAVLAEHHAAYDRAMMRAGAEELAVASA